MKTAISLPDELFAEADSLARRLGMSRSRLYATALEDYIARHQAKRVSERLDAVYGTPQQETGLDPALARAQLRALGRSEW